MAHQLLTAILFLGLFSGFARAEDSWSADASAALYLPANDSAFVLPVFSANRGFWHLESRYNYEDRDTASIFAGVTGRAGKTLTMEATPMLGIVFGNTSGVAPGLELAFNWHRWELTSENEYIYDSEDKSSDFFYNWSELSFYPKEIFRVGLVTQHTKAYQTEKDLESGALLGYERGNLSFTSYLFNIGFGSIYPVFSAGVAF